MNQQELNRCLERYFKEPSIDKIDVSRLINFIQSYAKGGQQLQMIKKIFKIAAEINMSKDNLKVRTKRYLHIINQILQQDDSSQPKYKYQQAVSAEIVHQYITLLRNILNYGPTDLLPDLKLFRKRWAKRITDQAYDSLKTEALKQLKLDLDKGFSDDIVKKLRKSYTNRKFSEADLKKYLPITNNQMSTEARKSSAVSSSSSQVDGQPRKKIKAEEFVAENRNESSDMVMPRHSFIPSNSNTYGNGPTGDSRRSNQIMYPPFPTNIYPSPPQYPPNRVFSSGLGERSNYTTLQHQQISYNTNYGYQNYNYGQGYQNYPNMAYDYQRNDPFTLQLPDKLLKLITNMDRVKKCWSFECKSCGILISTSQKYQEHMVEHFQGGQKQYQIDHSRADHSRKANKSLLPSLQQWIDSNRVRLSDRKFQVAIQGDVTGTEVCCICKGDLIVLWSDGLDSWVFEDAIRTTTRDNRRSICHSECYHTIEEFEKSSDELVE